MRSRPHKNWSFNTPDLDRSLKLAAQLGVSPLVGQLLVARGFTEVEAAEIYLRPHFDLSKFKGFHDPFKLAGMNKAVDRINKAIDRGEKICVYGDYDTDGTTATALLLDTFREINADADYYIPNRFTDGYGLSKETVKKIHKDKGSKLLITVDCGITSVKEVQLANQLGMDVIVTDHHQPDPIDQPPAHALISPKVRDNEYPYPDLAGVGLAFKLAHGLLLARGSSGNEEFLKSLLDLVVLGTVVDLVPLTGENRSLTRNGLDVLNKKEDNRPSVYKRERLGIRALCEVAGYATKQLVGHSLSFGLGPRINAAGRLDTARKVVELLITERDHVATRIASELDQANRERQELERQIRDHAQDIIENKIDLNKKSIVVYSDEWDKRAKGVVGIVASRLLEIHHKPVFVLAVDGEEATGSGRCIEGMNLADSLVSCTELLVKHGGHAAAAGLTIKTKNISKFEQVFEKYAHEHLEEDALVPKLSLDFETSLSVLTLDVLKELEQFEPFGRENNPPGLFTRRVGISGTPRLMGKERQHLSMSVSQGRDKKRAIAWRAGEEFITFNRPNLLLDIAFSPEINTWQGRQSVQLNLKDWQVCPQDRGMKWDVFPKRDQPSAVKLVDKRNVNKKNYLLNLLATEEPCIIYVQDEEMLHLLFTRLLPESIEGIVRHDETTSAAEETALLQQLRNGEIRAIASSSTFSYPEGVPFVPHFVFCHLTPSSEAFFKRCKPAFVSDKTSYLHLLYNDRDAAQMHNWIAQKYPARDALRHLYADIRKVIQSNGVVGYPEAEMLDGKLGTALTVQTGLTIFEELQYISRQGEPGRRLVKLLPAEKNEKNGLSFSSTYLEGEWVKQTGPAFIEFQLQENIESMWEIIKHESQITHNPDSSV